MHSPRYGSRECTTRTSHPDIICTHVLFLSTGTPSSCKVFVHTRTFSTLVHHEKKIKMPGAPKASPSFPTFPPTSVFTSRVLSCDGHFSEALAAPAPAPLATALACRPPEGARCSRADAPRAASTSPPPAPSMAGTGRRRSRSSK